ncbi:alpha/beta hydrolase [Corynebacterium aquilae]|uniref:Esterase n=1 Tax=Corynebacterium aquilae DSM 44791 TaxID=1431546 RepID=A0A1L7CDJ8_9CORY|nr:alpha/beta hydrolase family protein [Corynebacterium aquilae]APT83894.1 esterase [Corynebacterium aquilae DSM 44791]
MARLARSTAALLTAAALITATPAHAGTPAAALAGNTPQATLSTQAPELEQRPLWRDKVAAFDGHIEEVWAHSPSMNRDIPLLVLPAKDPGRPTLYLLNGADGGEGTLNWVLSTNALDFYKDKNVNVVIPMAGRMSYYTDWEEPANNLGGAQKWETFLTKELPGPIEKRYRANDKRVIAGMSMSATSSLQLAERNPGFYDGVGSFSGCAETNTNLGQFIIAAVVGLRGGEKPSNLWGKPGTPNYLAHDALANADKLRGTRLFISNGSGLAGKWDLWSSPFTTPELDVRTHIVNGGLIEAVSNICTHNLEAKLNSLGIPATYDFSPNGTHSWGYWQDALAKSWPTFADAMGIAGE